ncbi:MAG: valine--tRNA ligase [Melioribacteraceae bacterium]|nr:valine--tRNA ligase [Melioribacteraceae bacterium]MDD3558847.1 valine--tRNA ligase [Melioribacteraceae bacterium]
MNERNLSNIPKTYSPSEVEDKWYKYWEENKIFKSEVDDSKEPYTIVIPPPNVTGMLHLGHILNNTIQDVFIRYKRMKGFNACWVPGVDHASIATETKVIKYLADQGIDKYDIGREEFLKHCWEWTEKYGGIIFSQLRKLGVSLDWDRKRFTMDEDYYKKVIEAFVKLYKSGLIYKGYRMVNWCPASKSAISDEEVIYKEVNGNLWYFRYPLLEDKSQYLVVATTRPETMLGDTAVAVNPNDERYKNFIGRKVLLPIADREIPVIADEYVDMEFGTGAVKITPAHDINDYEMGKRHNLQFINIFNDDATTNENVPNEFQNLDRFEARKKVVRRFEELKLLEKIEDYTNNVGYSDRGNVPIEPYMSEQWFMKMDELAPPALKVVKNGLINFHPNHWIKTYEHWMSNIQDWCISRQLWWGHQIPVWYHKTTGEIYCEVDPPSDIENWRQEEDVLDTWASSWLWAQDVFLTEEEKKYYYPTNLLVTAPDIIFFWVARMIIAGMYFMNDRKTDAEKIPFRDVYFTSVVRDDLGRKMSKSLGNSPDPLDVIEEYGADALRFTILYIAPLGQDVLFSPEKCEIGRNFANKIWNAGRFLLMNAENIKIDQSLVDEHIDFTDEWIISRFNRTIKLVDDALDKFDINSATKLIYSYVWHDFCDWYVELSKNRLYSNNEEVKSSVLTRALNLFEDMLKIIHPFMPYISEEIWHLLKERTDGESISISDYPKFDESKFNSEAESKFSFVESVVTSLRNIRGEMNIAPSKQINVLLKTNLLSSEQKNYIKSLARINKLTADVNADKPKASASSVIKDCEIYVPLEGVIDLDVEKSRLSKEISRLEGALKSVNEKLANEKFVNNAPKDVVEKEKTKQDDWNASLIKLKAILNELS